VSALPNWMINGDCKEATQGQGVVIARARDDSNRDLSFGFGRC